MTQITFDKGISGIQWGKGNLLFFLLESMYIHTHTHTPSLDYRKCKNHNIEIKIILQSSLKET